MDLKHNKNKRVLNYMIYCNSFMTSSFCTISFKTKSANFTALYCRRCLKSIADELRICLEMWGRIRGNPSEVIRKAHGADLPSHDVCLSCKWGQVYVTYSQEQELIKELISHWQSRVDQWLFISLQSNKLFKEDFKQTI